MQANGIARAEIERKRVQAVIETLGGMRRRGGTLGEVAHDARNMVAALVLYCDLLSEPGVLSDGNAHYADELRLVTAASRRLVEKLMSIDRGDLLEIDLAGPMLDGRAASGAFPGGSRSIPGNVRDSGRLPNDPIGNLQQELLANRNLLDAISGPGVTLTVRTGGGARPVLLSGEDLTRVLVNLVKNAAEAMCGAGAIEIALRELPAADGAVPAVMLSIEDSGPGIPAGSLEKVFEPGYSMLTLSPSRLQDGSWPVTHRGLGLSITRSVVEAAGGAITASNRASGGARLDIELPVRLPVELPVPAR